jgi:protein-S-isoprenylcysteine O-methyltransferase Ste14
MADFSTLVRAEVELAKAEVGKSAKKAGIGGGAFGAALVMIAFSAFFFGIAFAEFLTWLGLTRWISYLITWFLLVLLGALAALFGVRTMKKIERPERTLDTLRDPPEVVHREAPGERHREVPTVSNGRVQLRPNESYKV